MNIECPNCNGTGIDRYGGICIVCDGDGVCFIPEETIEMILKDADMAY